MIVPPLLAYCTVERVARRLAMDRRTLHRRLTAEGPPSRATTPRERAESLLARSDRLFQRVELVGFSSLSARAWFRRQFGRTASDYRASLARERPASALDRMATPAA